MYWKMWIGCDPDTLIVVEADTMDEAMREAREVDWRYDSAQPMADDEAMEPATADKAYVVLTEVNGYRNLYGHVLFRDLDRAEEAADKARSTRCWDCVYVTEWTLV